MTSSNEGCAMAFMQGDDSHGSIESGSGIVGEGSMECGLLAAKVTAIPSTKNPARKILMILASAVLLILLLVLTLFALQSSALLWLGDSLVFLRKEGGIAWIEGDAQQVVGDREAASRHLIRGKWEGRNEKGEKEGIEFAADGVFRITWEGMSVLPGRYRFLDEGSIEIAFTIFKKLRAKVVTVTAEELVLTITDKNEIREKTYRHVEKFSFAASSAPEDRQ
jgi:hypothetical protein